MKTAPANQSLKLTEIAVDECAARKYTGIETFIKYFRAANCASLAVRRRSLTAIR